MSIKRITAAAVAALGLSLGAYSASAGPVNEGAALSSANAPSTVTLVRGMGGGMGHGFGGGMGHGFGGGPGFGGRGMSMGMMRGPGSHGFSGRTAFYRPGFAGRGIYAGRGFDGRSAVFFHGRRGFFRHGRFFPLVGVGLWDWDYDYGYGGGSCYSNCLAAGYGPGFCSVNAASFCY